MVNIHLISFFFWILKLSSVCGPIRGVSRHCSMCSETPTSSSPGQKGRLLRQIAAQAGFGYLRCWIMHRTGSSASWACPLYPCPLLHSASWWASYPGRYTPVALPFLCWMTGVVYNSMWSGHNSDDSNDHYNMPIRADSSSTGLQCFFPHRRRAD